MDTSAATPGTGEKLKLYWTKSPEGLAKWADSPPLRQPQG